MVKVYVNWQEREILTEDEYKELVSMLGGQKMANVYVNKKIYKAFIDKK